MATNIPTSSPPLSGGISRPADTRPRSRDTDLKKFAAPSRAQANYIPSPDALRTMIERALEALSNGVYWGRGSILNIVL